MKVFSKFIFKYVSILMMLGGFSTVFAEDAEIVDPTAPPTLPLAAAAHVGTVAQNLQVQAIFIGENRKEVVVNGQKLTLGSRIQGNKVIAIQPHQILLEKNGHTRALAILPSVKRPAKKVGNNK
jgi:MSHA biogenesis protein MshK